MTVDPVCPNDNISFNRRAVLEVNCSTPSVFAVNFGQSLAYMKLFFRNGGHELPQ